MKLDFEKMGGLIPAIVQDYNTNKVLMLGFMNEEAYEETKATGKVTFFSRTKNRIWMKGETSGNTLQVVTIAADCDNDTLLIKAIPAGMPYRRRHLFRRKECGRYHVLQILAELHRTASPGNAGRFLHHYPVSERHQPYGTEGRRRSRRNSY